MTAKRRLEGQSSEFASMIPERYHGFKHALELIFKEEGVKGLYRGFGLYNLYSLLFLYGFY